MVAPDRDDEEEEAAPTGAPRGGIPGMFQPPPDTSDEDPALPPGTLSIEVRDPDNKPLGVTSLVLVTLHQSVAKGQSKENKALETDGTGRLRLDHLEIGSSVSYWVKHLADGATFASTPAQLNPQRGVHVVMHVYPVVHDIEKALVVIQGAIYFEVKDDRVQVEEAITLFNFGRTAWFPQNLVVKLPKGFTALTSQSMMSDQGVDSVDNEGARLRGTFAPGRHDLDFRWQLPYDGERDLIVDVPLPPHVAIWRVMAAAGHETTLEVTDFPETQKRSDRQGQHVLVTEKQMKRDATLGSIHVMIRGLTVAGPSRIIATGTAALAVAIGLFLGVGKKVRSQGALKSERDELLSEIEDLERARLRGEVGPKTYEKARRDLVDALAQTLEVAT